jgi:hypothetical protein
MDFYDDLHILGSDGTWTAVDSKHRPCKRAAHGAVCHNRAIYIFGGLAKHGPLNDLWRLHVGESMNQRTPWNRDLLCEANRCSDSQIPRFYGTSSFQCSQ